jgi:hypothetical protein
MWQLSCWDGDTVQLCASRMREGAPRHGFGYHPGRAGSHNAINFQRSLLSQPSSLAGMLMKPEDSYSIQYANYRKIRIGWTNVIATLVTLLGVHDEPASSSTLRRKATAIAIS